MSAFLKTSLVGKIRNLRDFKNEALLPVFEAVVNSIHAIEDAKRNGDGLVQVKILRNTQKAMFTDGHEPPKISGFEIIDNGVGFDAANYESFSTSDSTYKLDKGCKGVGRFLWLKAFGRAEIDSVFADNGRLFRRYFRFDVHFTPDSGLACEPCDEADASDCRTIVRLADFDPSYRDAQSAYKTTEKIAQRILEHCLAYFITGSAPRIVVSDEAENRKVDLSSQYDNLRNGIVSEDIHINGEVFTIYHLRLFNTHAIRHEIVYCANGRGVESHALQSTLGTKAEFDEAGKKFFYAAYITSPYLDSTVDTYRQSFSIPETASELMMNSVSREQIQGEVIKHVKTHLTDVLESINKRKQEKVERYVAEQTPMLRAVVKYCPEVLDHIELNSSDEKICEVLYEHKGKAELDIKKRSEKLLKTQASSVDEIDSQYKDLTGRLEDFQRDELAAYVIRRKSIIDLLEKKLESNKDGKYQKEDIIHDIVFPRKSTSDDIGFENHNLWLLDEILAFHVAAYSDKEFKSFSSSTSRERPDVLTFSEVSDDKIARAISFIEFKRPQREKHDEDPTKQLYDYVSEIVDSESFKLKNGRVVGVNSETRFYCYAVCDLTDQIKRYARYHDYSKLQGEYGYYTYSRTLNAHTTIIDFNKIVSDANMRHKAFFHMLGL